MKTRVLVVEDHAAMRDRIVELLEDGGLIVAAQAVNGAQALQSARELQPDLVLLDLSLPDTSGLDVLRQLLRSTPSAPVIMLTAYEDRELERVCLEVGAAAFVGKSRLGETLLPVIQATLDRAAGNPAPHTV